MLRCAKRGNKANVVHTVQANIRTGVLDAEHSGCILFDEEGESQPRCPLILYQQAHYPFSGPITRANVVVFYLARLTALEILDHRSELGQATFLSVHGVPRSCVCILLSRAGIGVQLTMNKLKAHPCSDSAIRDYIPGSSGCLHDLLCSLSVLDVSADVE